ncbi:peptidylprolyl isomerase [Qipengyuania sp. JC766]|uniref:peptidylprolyl isomerase n=1 Tax=Qipengyuania sp. JC766 TaxID=3232139 RepID=UPI00345A1F03
MFARFLTAGALAALAFTPTLSLAQEADEAPAATTRVQYEAISYDQNVEQENVWLLDLSNGERVAIRLMPSWAPNHVERIKTLTRQGFYDGVIFHRVIEGFMAQSGDPTGTGEGGSQLPDLEEEFNPMPHIRGTVSMARAQSEDSANSQFFIVFYPNFRLDRNYTNFGRVIGNMAAVDAINRGEPPANPTRIIQASMASDNKPRPAMNVVPRETVTVDELNAPIE